MRVLISGASGLLGSALAARLSRDGHDIARLVRSPPAARDRVLWDPGGGGADPAALAGWNALVHLAGKNLATPWTRGARRAIRESRVVGTRGLAESVRRAPEGPRIVLCASAVGWYGDRGDEVLTEDAPGPGEGFLAGVCRDWEAAAAPAREAGARVVHLRTGIVLSGDGGALSKMLPPFRLGLGGRLGSGRQWMSWISLEDAVAAILFALTRDDVVGPVLVTSPEPVRNAVFTQELAAALHRPAFLPVPAALLRLLPGGFGRETLLASQRAVPERLASAGFSFAQPGLAETFRRLLDRT